MDWLTIALHILLAISIAIMGAVIGRANKLMDILKGSTAEPLWKKTRISLYFLTAFYIIIMIILLLSSNATSDYESIHTIVMNLSFFLTSILLLNLVNLDIKAFSSLFELIQEEA